MDMATQEFLFGHILPGTQDPYYDRSKKDYHRVEYAKLNFARETSGPEEVDFIISVVRAVSSKGPCEDRQRVCVAHRGHSINLGISQESSVGSASRPSVLRAPK